MPKTFLKKLFTRDLKLMIDYNIDPKVVECLNKLGAVKAKTIIEYGFRPNAEDSQLVYNDHRCALLTADKRTINEKKFPPCEHHGIILIKEDRASKDKICACIKALCRSGHRKKVSHNVIHLWEKKAIIHKHDKEVEEVQL